MSATHWILGCFFLFLFLGCESRDFIIHNSPRGSIPSPPYPFPPLTGVLVTSAGGQGTTYLMDQLDKAMDVNSQKDVDLMKHKNAFSYRRERLVQNRSVLQSSFMRPKYRGTEVEAKLRTHHYNRIIYLVGPPLHSIVSTTERYGLTNLHRRKLGCRDCVGPKIPRDYNTTDPIARYQALFRKSKEYGYDAFGWHFHFSTWLSAQKDTMGCNCWPPIWITDLQSIAANKCIFTKFLGKEARNINIEFRPTHSHPEDIARQYMDPEVTEIYSNLTHFVRKVLHQNLEVYAQLLGCRPTFTGLSAFGSGDMT